MRRFAAAAFLVFASSALAQEQTVTMTVTINEAQTMLNQIGALPWRDVNPLMQKLIGQVNSQMAPKPVEKPEPERKD